MTCKQCNQSYGEQFNGALACNTKEEADLWLTQEINHFVKHHKKSPEEAERIIKTNIGYMAGYFNDDTAKKIHRLFGAAHPIFGANYHND